jgi:hypothetical protein
VRPSSTRLNCTVSLEARCFHSFTCWAEWLAAARSSLCRSSSVRASMFSVSARSCDSLNELAPCRTPLDPCQQARSPKPG